MKTIHRRVAAIAAAALFTCGPAALPYLAYGEPALPSPPGPRELFLVKCSRCHEPERAYTVIGDYRAWVLTVASMSIKDRPWIPPENVKELIAYQASYREDRDALFGERCGECHTWQELRNLGKSATQWRTWIRFMAGRHGSTVSREECELLLCGLTETG